jgi:hypothetical protein
VGLLADADFQEFDKLHYEVENKLPALIQSLEAKRETGRWIDSLPHPSTHHSTHPPVHPSTHSSTHPPIHPSINPP